MKSETKTMRCCKPSISILINVKWRCEKYLQIHTMKHPVKHPSYKYLTSNTGKVNSISPTNNHLYIWFKVVLYVRFACLLCVKIYYWEITGKVKSINHPNNHIHLIQSGSVCQNDIIIHKFMLCQTIMAMSDHVSQIRSLWSS